jgi:hypothetical protein
MYSAADVRGADTRNQRHLDTDYDDVESIADANH